MLVKLTKYMLITSLFFMCEALDGYAQKPSSTHTAEQEETTVVTSKTQRVKGDALKASRRYRKLLNEGRRYVQKKKYKKGIKTFQRALAEDPNNVKLLGELSYAALKLGQYKLAKRSAVSCTRHTRQHKILGSCYYNLGRAEEESGDSKAAVKAYQQSLKVRPGNKTVIKRLKNLASPPPVKTSASACLGSGCVPVATIKELCVSLIKDVAKSTGLDPTNDSCTKTASRRLSKDSKLKMIALLQVEVNQEVFHYLAMKIEQGWIPAGLVGYVYSPGVFGIYEEGTFTIALRDLFLGDSKEVIVRSSISHEDSDLGIAEHEVTKVITEKICELREDKAYCYASLPIQFKYERFQIEEIIDVKIKKNSKLPIKKHYELQVDYSRPDQVKMILIRGKAPDHVSSHLGWHKIRNLPSFNFDVFTR